MKLNNCLNLTINNSKAEQFNRENSAPILGSNCVIPYVKSKGNHTATV